MKKHYLLSALALAGVIASGATSAATISNLSGQSCGAATGIWHFINNQVPAGSGVGVITAQFTSGTCVESASAVNKSTQHFYCEASGALLGAYTNLDGRLVLSDFSCGTPPKEPPPCDPKKDQSCK